MLNEIKEQPFVISRLLSRFFQDEKVNLELNLSNLQINEIAQIVILASGSSKNVADVAVDFFDKFVKIPIHVEFSSEFVCKKIQLRPNTLVIAVSQSGETKDTFEALMKAKSQGAFCLALTNNPNSKIHKESQSGILIGADKEKSIAATKTVSAQLLCLYALGLYFMQEREGDFCLIQKIIAHLKSLPSEVDSIIKKSGSIEKAAQNIKDSSGIMFVSNGIFLEALKEGALKIKETSYIMTEVLPSGEALHGHFAVLDSNKTLVCVVVQDECCLNTLNNVSYILQKTGAKSVILNAGCSIEQDEKTCLINLPLSEDYVMPFYIIVACQLLAYHISSLLGHDINNPRYLSKVVK